MGSRHKKRTELSEPEIAHFLGVATGLHEACCAPLIAPWGRRQAENVRRTTTSHQLMSLVRRSCHREGFTRLLDCCAAMTSGKQMRFHFNCEQIVWGVCRESDIQSSPRTTARNRHRRQQARQDPSHQFLWRGRRDRLLHRQLERCLCQRIRNGAVKTSANDCRFQAVHLGAMAAPLSGAREASEILSLSPPS